MMGLTDRTTFIADRQKFLEDTEATKMDIAIQPTKQKLTKREQVSIDDEKKQEAACADNNLMKDVKVKNHFLEQVKKNRKRLKKSYAERVKLRIGEYYQKKSLKLSSKSILSGTFDFDPEEYLDKFLLFDPKKTSGEKIFNVILEKIPNNNTCYIEHQEGTNALQIRKDEKQVESNED